MSLSMRDRLLLTVAAAGLLLLGLWWWRAVPEPEATMTVENRPGETVEIIPGETAAEVVVNEVTSDDGVFIMRARALSAKWNGMPLVRVTFGFAPTSDFLRGLSGIPGVEEVLMQWTQGAPLRAVYLVRSSGAWEWKLILPEVERMATIAEAEKQGR